MGSGTTAVVCISLGIKWIGYEINKIYEKGMDIRINAFKKMSVQTKII